jgi:hypothetical protein
MSAVVDKIRSKGYWDVAIRPLPYVDGRVDYGRLDELLVSATVRLRGWPVPFVDAREQLQRGDDWIGQDIDAELVDHFEAWRFFASGQFNQLRSVSADWRTGSEAPSLPAGFDRIIEVWEVLFYLTEVFELAARLALGPAGDERMAIDVALHGLEGRGLVVGQRNRAPFLEPYRAAADTLQRTVTVGREELVSASRQQAVTMAREFFLRFGWKPTAELLSEHQQELERS